MKKLFALMLALVMALSLAACGMEQLPTMERAPFEPIVVMDNETCKVTITNMRVTGGCEMDFLLENRGTEDMGIGATGYVNGVYCPLANWDADNRFVAPGEQGTLTMDFVNLGEFSVGAVTDIELSVSAWPSIVEQGGEPSYGDIQTQTVQIYPYGEENATVYEYAAKESHRVLVDNEYMTLIHAGNTSMGDCKLYLVNHTDGNVFLRAAGDDAILNGGVEGSVHLNIDAPAGAQTFGIVFPVWPGQELEGVHEYIKTDTITLTLELIDPITQEVLYTSDMITLSPSGIKVTE